MPNKKEIKLTQKHIKNLSFEQANQRLEVINDILNKNNNSQKSENKELTLNEMCNLYEEGQLLLKHCETLLNEIQQRIEIAKEEALIPYK